MQTGGRLWFKGNVSEETGAEHFAEDLAFPIGHVHNHQSGKLVYPYDFDEINEITGPLGVPWESSKDVPFSSSVPFIGFLWNLDQKTVTLTEPKKAKYIQAIHEWKKLPTHTLEETQKLYGKLLHCCHIIPRGRAYLTSLEKMMATFRDRPFTPRHPPKHLEAELTWWESTLSLPSLSREIPGGRQITDVHGYSDASSSVGIGIIVGNKWRAWRLLPGWKSRGRDISWAEAVGMELLTRAILNSNSFQGIQIFGDNTGVVEGWWTGRSRNTETNSVFRRIHELLEAHDTILTTRYVNTNHNPADGPSRGTYPASNLLLPPVDLPDEVKPFLADFDAPLRPSERVTAPGPPPPPKAALSLTERRRRNRANADANEQTDEAEQTPSPL